MLSLDEIRQVLQDVAANTDLRRGYGLLLDLLQDLANTHTEDSTLHFTSLFTQLMTVCRRHDIDHHSIDSVRRRARNVLQGKEKAKAETLQADCLTTAAFAEALTNNHIYISNKATLQEKAENQNGVIQAKRKGQSTESFTDYGITAVVTSHLSSEGTTILTEHGDTWRLAADEGLTSTIRLLREGQTLRLLDCEVRDDVLHARYIIIEPDFLIDISTLAGCMAYYGEEPQNYLLRLLVPREPSEAIVLGNVANEFVDSIVHAPDDAVPDNIRRDALQKAFANAPLDFLALNDTLGKGFTESQREQFEHIYECIHQSFPSPEMGLQRDNLLLEPTLLCPALGLRGRLDIMSADGHTVIELKSGRARESTPPIPQRTHRMQMLLYAEMMRRNFGVRADDLTGYLWYSRYPILMPLRRAYAAVIEALNLRNRIVLMMRFLADGDTARLLPLLTPERLNVKGCDDSVYHRLYLPKLKRVCSPLQAMDAATRAYFCAFTEFLSRELWLGKTTDNRPFSTRGFARTWTSDATSKIADGEMIGGLRFYKSTDSTPDNAATATGVLSFSINNDENPVTPAFRPGDAVILYRCDTISDNATNHPLYRAFVSEITATHLTLRLLYPQSAQLFCDSEAHYAVEHDHMDVSVTNCFEGLWHLAATYKERRDLLLGRRKPHLGKPKAVSVRTTPAVDDIVSRALAAEDYFLLVGPPGTGKTSVALRALTLNFIADAEDTSGLLLTAYTNRAVDEICAMLESAQVSYVRIGGTNSCAAPYRPRLLSELVKGRTRRELRKFLNDTPVVVGTVLTLSRRMELFRVKSFALAVIDEASQILEPQLLTLLCATDAAGKPVLPRFVMVGDHKQLPAVVLQDETQTAVTDSSLLQMKLHNLRSSLFERLYQLALRDGNEVLTATLTRQGRMHSDIAAYASAAFYGGRLQAVPLPHQQVSLQLPAPTNPWEAFVSSTRLGFIDIQPEGDGCNLKCNDAEAHAAAHLIRAVCNLYERAEGGFDAAAKVGVIVPFRAQINRVRQALRREGIAAAYAMTIDTVECYQGSQRDIIVFCTTISRPWQLAMISSPVDIGGTSVDRKLNVATTRARLQLFIIGHAPLLRRSPLYSHLINTCTCFQAADA